MATEAFAPNVEYEWKVIGAWRWDKEGGAARDWNARGNWTTVKVPKGWSQTGPHYVVSIVFSDESKCPAAWYSDYPVHAKCLHDWYPTSSELTGRTHVRERWRWEHSGQLVKEVCRDITDAEVTALLDEIAQHRNSKQCGKVWADKPR